jgi:hypothetical protein
MMAVWANASCAGRIVDARFLCRIAYVAVIIIRSWLGLGGLLLSQEWNKAHLINHLAEVHGYRHYLELCTFTTGRVAELLGEWRSKRDPMEAFAFFQAHKRVLLNLITTDEFFARERS